MSHPRNDLTLFRGMMILASLSPVFLVWAIVGMEKIPDQIFIPVCILMVLVPHYLILRRIRVSLKTGSQKEITIETAKDAREHLLTYFMPLALPVMAVSFSTWRGFSATLFLFAIMAFASWHLRVFYVNVFFALFGYRIFKIAQPPHANSHSIDERILIAKRTHLDKGVKVMAVNLGGNVYYVPSRNRKK
jgi:uncharacterized membrane protein